MKKVEKVMMQRYHVKKIYLTEKPLKLYMHHLNIKK